jgi:hypothetical protein
MNMNVRQRIVGPASVAVFLGLVGGCVFTEVTHDSLQHTTSYFRKIAVCARTATAGTHEESVDLENSIVKGLKKHSIEAAACHDLFHGTIDPQLALGALRKNAFDGLLLLQRAIPDPQQSPNIAHDVNTVEQAFVMYVSTASHLNSKELEHVEPFLYGKDRTIKGKAQLIAIKDDKRVWLIDGIAEGPASNSIEKFYTAASRRIVGQLISNGLIKD